LVDTEFSSLIQEALALMKEGEKEGEKDKTNIVIVQIVDDPMHPALASLESIDYEDLLVLGDPNIILKLPDDEWDAISLNYTSGTTGNPKGVVSHHRGAYLNSLGNMLEWNMPIHAKFLWIVPLFHCNGWCFPWTMAVSAGTSYFLRQIRAGPIFEIIEKYKVQYFAGAPVTMNTMLAYPDKYRFKHEVKMWAAGAPPPTSVIKRFKEEIGVSVQCAYGLTETYGPICTHNVDFEWLGSTGSSDNDEKNNTASSSSSIFDYRKGDPLCVEVIADSKLKGFRAPLTAHELLLKSTYLSCDTTVEDLKVFNPETMVEVPADGLTIGEVMVRGNIVMKGYLGNEKATMEAFEGGYFRTGDLAVHHGNGRIEIKDRSKDVIISGGENISSIEVEAILLTHHMIDEAAVIAMPDEKWGEVPCAFVTLRAATTSTTEGGAPTSVELIAWARTKMAGYQAPKMIRLVDALPKTSTGKVQKNVLRNMI
jgi:fatty-acyl-CoA synthase